MIAKEQFIKSDISTKNEPALEAKVENGNYAKEERSFTTSILHDTPRYNLDHSLGVVEEVKPLKNQRTGEVYRAL